MSLNKYVSPKLIGGLGNQLFILAAAMDIALKTNRIIIFHERPGNPHSDEKRRLTDLFPHIPIDRERVINKEYSGLDFSWKDILSDIDHNQITIFISGYNQHPQYIPDGFSNFINNIPVITNYNEMNDVAFLHVRRGDYVGHNIFYIDTDMYYTSAVKNLLNENPNVKILVISNDLTWSNNYIKNLLKDILPSDHILSLDKDYTATESLKIMANCLGGGICANSTFSWWGAYVNKNRPIYMPCPWSSYDASPNLGLYFEGVKRVSWNSGEIL
jgi:hypothetical protein